MDAKSSIRLPPSCSDNRKSKIQNLKWPGLSVIAFVLVVTWAMAQAQPQAKIPRIGYVSGTGNASNQGPYVEAWRQGLRDLCYVEGKNIVIEYRGAEGKSERMPILVTELVELKVDVLVLTIGSILAAKQATKTIPIVMVTQVDPVATGLVDSLARPGGNITGLATLQRDLSGKRLELLTEVVPRLSRVGILRDAEGPVSSIGLKDYEAAARTLKIRTQPLDVRGPNPDLAGAFREAVKGRVNAVVTITNNPLFVAVGTAIAGGPPHRSGRAELPHPALALGNNANAGRRVRMITTFTPILHPRLTYPLKRVEHAHPALCPGHVTL